MISYRTLSALIVIGGTIGMMYFFISDFPQVGYWMGGLVVGISVEPLYDFIHEIGSKEDIPQ